MFEEVAADETPAEEEPATDGQLKRQRPTHAQVDDYSHVGLRLHSTQDVDDIHSHHARLALLADVLHVDTLR